MKKTSEEDPFFFEYQNVVKKVFWYFTFNVNTNFDMKLL
jgi:hypothetical protein